MIEYEAREAARAIVAAVVFGDGASFVDTAKSVVGSGDVVVVEVLRDIAVLAAAALDMAAGVRQREIGDVVAQLFEAQAAMAKTGGEG